MLTPNSNNIINIDFDFGDLKTEINAYTRYVKRILDIISYVPIECKYYFLEITDFRRCFVAIRKIIVMHRTDYNKDEELVKELFEDKYKSVRPNTRKKFFRPSARNLFYFLDRRIPFDVVMFEVIKLNEKLRDEKVRQDPIMQTKNTDMLRYIASLKHQCTLIRNLMYSYLYNTIKVKTIYVSFKNFFDAFSDFDKHHGDFYEKAKNVIGNEDFHGKQGINVQEFDEKEYNKVEKEVQK